MDCLWTTLAPVWSEGSFIGLYSRRFFSLSLSDAKHNFDELWWLIIGFFLCPQLIWILFAFLLKVHYIAPRWPTFQGVSRNVDVIFVKNFANSIDVLVWKPFLFWNQISTFQRSCLFKYNCWNEIREISVFEKLFLKFELHWSKTQHTIQCSPLIVLYFENRNDPL